MAMCLGISQFSLSGLAIGIQSTNLDVTLEAAHPHLPNTAILPDNGEEAFAQPATP